MRPIAILLFLVRCPRGRSSTRSVKGIASLVLGPRKPRLVVYLADAWRQGIVVPLAARPWHHSNPLHPRTKYHRPLLRHSLGWMSARSWVGAPAFMRGRSASALREKLRI